jgi:aminomethyltransferase
MRCQFVRLPVYFILMAKQSTLSDFHRANGAVFAEQEGWLIPSHFGSVVTEHETVRSGAGLIDFSHRGLLQFTGSDRLPFLQGMLSNDLKQLKPFQGQYATLLTQQGKVIADLRVLCSLNSFYLDFWEPLKDKILVHLARYLVADEVEIADRSQEYSTLSIQGPRSEALLHGLVGAMELPGPSLQHMMVTVDGAAICIVRSSHTGENGYDLIVPLKDLDTIARRLTDLGAQFSASWIGAEAQNILRLEAGIPRYGVDFNEDNLLLEVGLEYAVSFNKGCYLGQEVVERIRSRGHVNKRLCGLFIDGQAPASAGDRLQRDGKEAGAITSSVFSPRLDRPIALGYMNKDFWTPGTELSLVRAGGAVRAIVAALPFVSSS